MTKHKSKMATAGHGQLLAEHTRHSWLVNRRGQSTHICREYIGDAC